MTCFSSGDENAWEDDLWWQAQDRRVLKRINVLLADIVRSGTDGTGKPEALKHDVAGYWSRRITHEHHLVRKLADGQIRIAACRYHYGQPRGSSAASRMRMATTLR
ncbi:MAG: Txe/YoeB family addiction module toxin [Tetrasphaera sp.]